MSTVKLTLSMDRRIVEKAKRIAQRNKKSVSGMVTDFFEGLPEDRDWRKKLTPRVRRLIGLIPDQPEKSYRQMIEEALCEKYGTGK